MSCFKKILALVINVVIFISVAAVSAREKIAFDGEIKRDVVYVERGKKKIMMDIFIPPGKPTGAPAIMVIHGGGFVAGHRQMKEPFCIEMAKKGLVVFNIDYRLAPKYPFPAAIDDVRCAIRWVAKHAKEYGADPDRIGISGCSAGGYLASMILFPPTDAYMSEPCADSESAMPRIKAASLYYGVYDLAKSYYYPFPFIRLMYRMALEGGPKKYPEKYKSYSAMDKVRGDLPPILIQVGDADPLLPESGDLYERLIGAGVNAEIVIYKGAKHGFVVYRSPLTSPAHENKTADFFLKYL